MSNLDSSLTLAVLYLKFSFDTGVVRLDLNVQTSFKQTVNRSHILSCLFETKPPFLHDIACDSLNFSRQAQYVGKCLRGMLYLNLMASRYSSLSRSKFCSLIGNALSQQLAPLWHTCSTCGFRFAGRLLWTDVTLSFLTFGFSTFVWFFSSWKVLPSVSFYFSETAWSRMTEHEAL